MTGTSVPELLARLRELRAAVTAHKSTIRKETAKLHSAAAELAALERECSALGISIVHQQPQHTAHKA